MIEELTGKVFATRSAAHLAHFATKSYAQHMALDAFYTDVIEAIDSVVEVYQGKNGLIESVTIPSVSPVNITGHLVTEVAWIEANRDTISEGNGTVGALIDELAAVYQRTIYKLENLK